MITKAPNLVTLTEIVMAVFLLVIIFYLVTLCFIGSVRKTMRRVTRSMQIVSSCWIWFLLVPGINYVITCILLPFAIPRSIYKALQEQGRVSFRKVISLSRFGIALCLFGFLFFGTIAWIGSLSHQNFSAHDIPEHSVIASAFFFLFFFAQSVTFIVYWRKLVAIRTDLDAVWEQRATKKSA